ncbi:siroheme synthase CysG [Moraxella boevrei]|uniref:siroheme synthase CysG n=1 Tax=Faucicola boevrei TaxID=346665 RepID=UPI0037364343
MKTLPLFFNLQNCPVLLVGGGEVAMRKAELLAQVGANITFVAPAFEPQLLQKFQQHHQFIQDDYQEKYLKNQRLVIACTDNQIVNEQVFYDSDRQYIPVNVVDNPELCRFIFPAIVDREPVTVAISSNGTSPVLARLLRAKLESLLPQNLGKLAELAGKYRQTVKQKLPHITARRQLWEKVFGGETLTAQASDFGITSEIAEQIFANDFDKAEQQLADLIEMFANDYQDKGAEKIGKVYIVGAGAGDPDLLTFKALRYMQQADIVFYDNLVSEPILNLCRRDASKIYVGKKANNHAVAQETINDLLMQHAKFGKRVLRLKGGDPLIFGRGGEEAERLADAGIDYEIVAGITSATAGASCAGIPLTHRDYAQSVKFVTACLKKDTPNENYQDLLDDTQTVVFYMGLGKLDILITGLIKAGKSADTPIAIVSNASLPNQRVLTGTLQNIVEKQAVARLPAPALLIMGNVVKLRERLGKLD